MGDYEKALEKFRKMTDKKFDRAGNELDEGLWDDEELWDLEDYLLENSFENPMDRTSAERIIRHQQQISLGSGEVVKAGFDYHGGKKQRYLCKSCGRTFCARKKSQGR